MPGEKNPVKVAKGAIELAEKQGYDVLLVDTAGRLHLDTELMNELEEMKKILSPARFFLSRMRLWDRMPFERRPILIARFRLPAQY